VLSGATVLATAAKAVGSAGLAAASYVGSGLNAAGTAISGILGGGTAAGATTTVVPTAAGTAAGTTAAGTAAAVPTVAGLTAAQASAAAPAIAAQVASAGSGLIATGSAPLAAAGSGVLLPGATTAAGLAGPSLAASAIPTIGGAGVMPLGYTNLAGQFVQGAAPEVMMSSYGAVPLTGGQALTPQALQGLASTPSTLGGSAGSTSSMLANTSVPNALQGSMSTGTFNSATTGLTQAEASALSNAANTGGALVPNAPAATTPQLSLGMKSVSPQLMSNEAGSIMMEGLSSGESGLGGMSELVKDNKMLTAMLMYGIGSELLGDEEDLEEERPPYVNTYTEKGLKGLNVYGENPVAGLNRRKRRGPGFNQTPRVGRSGGIT
jgi:hypothetical protein